MLTGRQMTRDELVAELRKVKAALATQVEKTKVVEQVDIARCVGANAAEIERLQGQMDAVGKEIHRLHRIITKEIDAHNLAKDEIEGLRKLLRECLPILDHYANVIPEGHDCGSQPGLCDQLCVAAAYDSERIERVRAAAYPKLRRIRNEDHLEV